MTRRLLQVIPAAGLALFCAAREWVLGQRVEAAPAVAAVQAPDTTSAPAAQREATFCNPIGPGADPWVIRVAEPRRPAGEQSRVRYYLCQAAGHAIAVCSSDRLTRPGPRRIVWRAPPTGWNARQIWAPELHRLAGRWYIYYAASDGDNANHRLGVLEAETDDPQGAYRDRGMLYTGDDPETWVAEGGGGTRAGPQPPARTGAAPAQDERVRRAGNRWAIDATILAHRGRMYLLWSGWPANEDAQYLYIAPLENPWTVGGPRVRICGNADHVWERVGDDPQARGLHEAPQVLRHGARTFVVFSCSGAWLPEYKLGLLELAGDGDPLDPASWRKHPEPVFQRTDAVCGVGHASFAKSPDGTEDWIIYHAKKSRAPGWERLICTQAFDWQADGRPDFGRPATWGEPLALPSGE
ncbi:MAG: glycoside hydrolase family 43 protein [Planctomycetota bacterium]